MRKKIAKIIKINFLTIKKPFDGVNISANCSVTGTFFFRHNSIAPVY